MFSSSLCYFLLHFPKTPYMYDIVRYPSRLLQIRPHYSLYDYDKSHDVFHYNTKYRRLFKEKYYKHGLVDNHHIFPKQFQHHPLMQEFHVDVACSKNIMFLPNRSARYFLNDPSLIYHNAHPKYNSYVEKQLQMISQHRDKESRHYQLSLFFMYLQQGLETNDSFLKGMFKI
mgnify:FL=1